MVMAAGTRDDAEERVTLEGIVLASPVLGPILREWSAISLPDCWLVAGAVVQTVWNDAFGFPPEHGLKDVDLVYFDISDVSEIAEVRHAERIRRLFGGCPAAIDVKNEARVHLWYAEKFGREIAPYRSAVDAIATFPTIATAVGIRPGSSGLLCRCSLRPRRSVRARREAEQGADQPRRLQREIGAMAAALAGAHGHRMVMRVAAPHAQMRSDERSALKRGLGMDEEAVISRVACEVRERLAGESSGHDWWHTYRVWKMAERLARGTAARPSSSNWRRFETCRLEVS